MDIWIQDFGYAVLIGGIIAWMATIDDPKLKALVYSLPLPILFTLFATGVNITALNVIGLSLVMVFLWSAYIFYTRWRWHILVADITAACLYVLLGLAAIYILPAPSFLLISMVYILFWIVFLTSYTPSKLALAPSDREKIAPSVKFAGATMLAFVMLRLKSLLSGIVVTFPFSGVFAVIESRKSLETQAAIVTRNSPAVLAMFAVIYYGSPYINRVYLVLLSIGIYSACLWLIYRFAKGRV